MADVRTAVAVGELFAVVTVAIVLAARFPTAGHRRDVVALLLLLLLLCVSDASVAAAALAVLSSGLVPFAIASARQSIRAPGRASDMHDEINQGMLV